MKKENITDCAAKVVILTKALREAEMSIVIGSRFDTAIVERDRIEHMLELATDDLRRLEEQEFAALTVDEVKARIDTLRKGA